MGQTTYYHLAFFDFGDQLDTAINVQKEIDRFVVIDTLRATTTLSTLQNSGVEKIYVVKNKEAALELKQNLSIDCLLVGEEGGHKIEGFDFGNSPSALAGKDLSSRHVIFTSSNARHETWLNLPEAF